MQDIRVRDRLPGDVAWMTAVSVVAFMLLSLAQRPWPAFMHPSAPVDLEASA